MIKTMNDRFGKCKWTFMRDSASPHTAATTTWFLISECLVLPGWPPNNPDLNPIEMVSSIIKVKGKQEHPSSTEEQKHVIEQVWSDLDQGVLNKLVTNFPSRLQMLVATQGRNISQYLPSHSQRISAIDAEPDADFRPFSAEEDEFMVGLRESAR
jgi:hypothetical protein